MNSILRGISNILKAPLRSTLVVSILSISSALSLVLFIAASSSSAQIRALKESTGTDLHIMGNQVKQGSATGSGSPGKTTTTGEALKMNDEDIGKLENLPHIREVKKTILAEGNSAFDEATDEQKKSTDLQPLNNSKRGVEPKPDFPDNPRYPAIAGSSGDGEVEAHGSVMSGDLPFDGERLDAEATRKALMTRALAEKNNLKIGDTFKLYGQTFEIVGLFGKPLNRDNVETDGQNESEETPTIVIPVKDMKELSGKKTYGKVTAVVDDVENVDTATNSIKSTFPKITIAPPLKDNKGLVQSLGNLQGFVWFGFISALTVSGLIIFFLMFLLVRNRRREIGIFKAIGGKARALMAQYSSEGLSLVALASAVAVALAVLTAEALTKSMLAGVKPAAAAGGGPQMMRRGASGPPDPAGNTLNAADIIVSNDVLWPGLLTILLIAVVGIAVPVALTSRIRPVEAMRQE